jgi:hypothetical protein
MDDAEGVSRRGVLRTLGACGLGAVGGCLGAAETPPTRVRDGARAATAEAAADPPVEADAVKDRPTERHAMTTGSPSPRTGRRGLSNVRGAMYFPSGAFNHYQMWDRYDPSVVARDLTYARNLGLNALRVILSYPVWGTDPQVFRDRLDHFFEAAAERGLSVLPVLFESIGDDPTPANVARNAPVRSPGGPVLRDRRRWDEPGAFVRWVADRYGDHDALLAVEIINEPGELRRRVEFTREMLRVAREAHESVPLTVGCRKLSFNELYEDAPLDVLQFHYNLPPTEADMRERLRRASAFARKRDAPIWLTEWQRTRVEPPDKMRPHYASLADVVRESDVDGDFFWQLMLNPAYNLKVRSRGRVNGLFTEDGGVYSVEDARALAGVDDWSATEVRPDWVASVGSETS